MDLDGNDLFYFWKAPCSSTAASRLFIVEYTPNFRPLLIFGSIRSPSCLKCDDYFGASLSAYDKVFSGAGYRLVCCNTHTDRTPFSWMPATLTVRRRSPRTFEDIFRREPYLSTTHYGHKPSPAHLH